MSYCLLYFLLIHIVFLWLQSGSQLVVSARNDTVVDIGLILDLNSSMGVMAESCIAMALSDFYSAHPHYTTRLALHTKNSGDLLNAASSALELLNKAEVQAIILGPHKSNEAKFVIELGEKAHVPIISFSVTSSSLSPSKSPYFILTAVADSSQLKAITAIVQGFQWHEVVILYEDNEYGKDFIPFLTDAFQEASIQLPYISAISAYAEDFQIKHELSKLMNMQTRVFLVHMSSLLGSRLFFLAEEAGMMSQGYAWIITDALSNSLSSMDATTIKSMEGVLGIRPFSPKSKNLENFETRWEQNFQLMQPNVTKSAQLNILGLWAYDTVWALAISVEKIRAVNSTFLKTNNYKDACGITNLRISEAGPGLLNELLQTKYQGLSGEVSLKNGQLETPAFEIINIIGNGPKGERTIGYWIPNRGFSRKLVSADHEKGYSISTKKLKKIIWPGDSTDRPKGWDIPRKCKKIRVGVPKKDGFQEFVNVVKIGDTKQYNVTGFSIDIFKAALQLLPFELEPEFAPFVNDSGEMAGTYDELVYKLHTQTYEAVVGDTTIRAQREKSLDFSLPYTESGVVMVVRVEPDKLKNMWIFLKPLSWDLWLTIVVACIFIGFIVRIMERHVTQKPQLGMLFWFPLTALAFPERNMVANSWARFVLVVWLFVAYILMQSYTANLSSILTVDQITHSVDRPACVGYQAGSFVLQMLESWNFSVSKPYSTMEEYDEALSKGCKNGGVDAIFDEIPYIKVFLHKYGSKYKVVGTTYKTGGFGFVFPSGSRLVKYISTAILTVMEDGRIQEIEKNYFGDGNLLQDQVTEISRNSRSLTAYSFSGLFTITASLTILALVCSEFTFALRRRHNQNGGISRVHSIVEMTAPADDNLSINDRPQDSSGSPDHVGGDDDDDDMLDEVDQRVVEGQDNNDNHGDEVHGR